MALKARMAGSLLLKRVYFVSIQRQLLALGPISSCWNEVQSFWRKRKNVHAEGGGQVRTREVGPRRRRSQSVTPAR